MLGSGNSTCLWKLPYTVGTFLRRIPQFRQPTISSAIFACKKFMKTLKRSKNAQNASDRFTLSVWLFLEPTSQLAHFVDLHYLQMSLSVKRLLSIWQTLNFDDCLSYSKYALWKYSLGIQSLRVTPFLLRNDLSCYANFAMNLTFWHPNSITLLVPKWTY